MSNPENIVDAKGDVMMNETYRQAETIINDTVTKDNNNGTTKNESEQILSHVFGKLVKED